MRTKESKPGSFVKYKSFVVRCSGYYDDPDVMCEICKKEWKDLNCFPPCEVIDINAMCLNTFGWNRYPRPIKGQDYSSLKLQE